MFCTQTPNLDWLKNNSLYTESAHGKAVGLPDDTDMGNSEVGHNAIGARVFDQGAALIDQAITSGEIFQGTVWNELIQNVENNFVITFDRTLSDGKVHSNISH